MAELGLEPRPPGFRAGLLLHGAHALLLETSAWRLRPRAVPCGGPLTDCSPLLTYLESGSGSWGDFNNSWMPPLHPFNIGNSFMTHWFVKFIQQTFEEYLLHFRQ